MNERKRCKRLKESFTGIILIKISLFPLYAD